MASAGSAPPALMMAGKKGSVCVSEEKKKEIDDFMVVLKNMNKDELTATKFFGLGVVAARESKEPNEDCAHE